LGANAVLAVSLAVAAADSLGRCTLTWAGSMPTCCPCP
jgi:enolase